MIDRKVEQAVRAFLGPDLSYTRLTGPDSPDEAVT